MASIPISSLYLPGCVVFQSRAAAVAAIPGLPAYDPNQLPKYWGVPLAAGQDGTEEFTVHNLHDANGTPTWGVTYMSTAEAAAFNIPPDPTSATNAPVYPNSVPIPMVYPLPSGDSVIDTPFGLIISNSTTPAVTPGAPAAAGADPTVARILTICNGIAQKVGAPIG